MHYLFIYFFCVFVCLFVSFFLLCYLGFHSFYFPSLFSLLLCFLLFFLILSIVFLLIVFKNSYSLAIISFPLFFFPFPLSISFFLSFLSFFLSFFLIIFSLAISFLFPSVLPKPLTSLTLIIWPLSLSFHWNPQLEYVAVGLPHPLPVKFFRWHSTLHKRKKNLAVCTWLIFIVFLYRCEEVRHYNAARQKDFANLIA